MFADPQSVTINGVAISLPRTGGSGGVGSFQSADRTVGLTIKQNVTPKRFRAEARITQGKVAADPISAINSEVSTSVYLVIDRPRWGFSDAEIDYLKDALVAWAADAQTNKLLGLEY